jgi:hypothetical protein
VFALDKPLYDGFFEVPDEVDVGSECRINFIEPNLEADVFGKFF